MELNRNPGNYFAEIEQAAFEPSNFVPGIDGSPDKMLQARIFSYADAHRYRVGTNYQQLPVNRPHTEVHSYSKEGAMRYEYNPPEVPVYAPNSVGGPAADPRRAGDGGWQSDGELVRSAATLHPEDDDWGQAGTLVREVMSAEERDRLVETIAGHVGGVTRADVRDRAVQYWKNVDAEIGSRVEAALPPLEGSTAPGEQLSEPNPDGDLVGTDVAGKI
jgi:catalase